MTPGLRAFLGTAITSALLFTTGQVMADQTTATYQVKSLVSFDDQAKAGNWIVQGSKFATQGFPEYSS